MERESLPKKTYEDYTIAVVFAMSFEMTAFRCMLDSQHQRLPSKPDDSNIYTLGDVHGHNVVLACLSGQQGKGAAAVVSCNMWRSFPSIKWRFLVGIGGGIPSPSNDIRLGDVVVSMPQGQYGGVVQYDLGKDTEDGFILKGFLCPPPALLRNAVVAMQGDHEMFGNKMKEYITDMNRKWPRLIGYKAPDTPDILFLDDYSHPPASTSCVNCDRSQTVARKTRATNTPEIHYGLIASGDRVIKSTKKRREALKGLGDVLCVEMEAAGLMTEHECMVIRGISDYADSHKNDDWHRFAATTAAACTKEILSYVSPAEAISAPTAYLGRGIQQTGSGSIHIKGDSVFF